VSRIDVDDEVVNVNADDDADDADDEDEGEEDDEDDDAEDGKATAAFTVVSRQRWNVRANAASARARGWVRKGSTNLRYCVSESSESHAVATCRARPISTNCTKHAAAQVWCGVAHLSSESVVAKLADPFSGRESRWGTSDARRTMRSESD